MTCGNSLRDVWNLGTSNRTSQGSKVRGRNHGCGGKAPRGGSLHLRQETAPKVREDRESMGVVVGVQVDWGVGDRRRKEGGSKTVRGVIPGTAAGVFSSCYLNFEKRDIRSLV